ncbi:MAG: CinA family protein [Clostridia bacterium]|nr:CinA family protein [Clostridia bacterium]
MEEFKTAYIRTVAVPRDKLDTAINALKSAYDGISVNLSGRYGDLSIEIKYPEEMPSNVFEEAYRQALTVLNDYVYALEDVGLAERLIQLLKLRKTMFSVAESFTGGGVGGRIVEISGASEVFFEGLNTYSNQSKMERLGVNEATLKQFGAVSRETAYEMARGLLNTGNCGLCVATTGIAGPKSDNTQKPVGLVYIAVGCEDDVQVYGYNLKCSRKDITETAINLALFLAFKTLK